MASLRLGGRYNPQWHRPILAATEESGVPAPVVVVLAHVTPGRLVAAGDVARLADPALAWAPDPPARSALASAGFVPITVHLDSAEPVR
jgi:hypothetical protein